jgi:hypothetical protein
VSYTRQVRAFGESEGAQAGPQLRHAHEGSVLEPLPARIQHQRTQSATMPCPLQLINRPCACACACACAVMRVRRCVCGGKTIMATGALVSRRKRGEEAGDGGLVNERAGVADVQRAQAGAQLPHAL